MNLVDYGSSDDEQPVAQKREAPEDEQRKDNESNKKQKIEAKKSVLPPLPEEFDEVPEKPLSNNNKGDSGRNLLPPQLWRKKANISTEDITWSNNSTKKTNKSPAK